MAETIYEALREVMKGTPSIIVSSNPAEYEEFVKALGGVTIQIEDLAKTDREIIEKARLEGKEVTVMMC